MGNIIVGGIVFSLFFMSCKKLYNDNKNKKCKGGCYGCASAKSCGVAQPPITKK